ncbi:MAG TPA: polyprenyl diphosphate synthase [Candidatus Paceibacterota bacterium]
MGKSLKIIAEGRVQGVFFRATAKRIADSHGLTGYARNLSDGRVEIVACGEEPGLRALLDWCYRGSLLAHVDGLSFEWGEPVSGYSNFAIPRDGGSLVVDQVKAFTNLGRRALNRVDRKVEASLGKMPKHIVIVPDGNRRWAKERGLPSWRGHKEGLLRTKELMLSAYEKGIPNMTFWGFSTENWSRDKEEVGWLMQAFKKTVSKASKDLHKNKVAFRHLGRKDRLDKSLADAISKLEEETKIYKGRSLSIALDYGGRDELVRAVQKVNQSNMDTNEESIAGALDTAGLPDPDLIIRTSGEQRLSGIMPWQGTYAELYFTPLLFPDFTPDQFALALSEYKSRFRRFGS